MTQELSIGASLSTTLQNNPQNLYDDVINSSQFEDWYSNWSLANLEHDIGKDTLNSQEAINLHLLRSYFEETPTLRNEEAQPNKPTIIARKKTLASKDHGNAENLNLNWSQVGEQIWKPLSPPWKQRRVSTKLLEPIQRPASATHGAFSLRIVNSKHLKKRRSQMSGCYTVHLG